MQSPVSRQVLLAYFGEQHEGNCGNCDNCKDPKVEIDANRFGPKSALSACIRANEKIGVHMVVDILRGSSNQELKMKGFHLLENLRRRTRHFRGGIGSITLSQIDQPRAYWKLPTTREMR
jgi:superfamily II DNA helicase RecQ